MIKLPLNVSTITRSIFISCILLALLFIFSSVWKFISNIDELSLKSDSSLITSKFSYYIDYNNNFDIETLFKTKESKSVFIPSLANNIPYDLGHQSYWIKINITNNTPNIQHLVLHADNCMLAFFDVYKIDSILQNVELISASNLNTLSLLKAKQIILTASAINDIKEIYCD